MTKKEALSRAEKAIEAAESWAVEPSRAAIHLDAADKWLRLAEQASR